MIWYRYLGFHNNPFSIKPAAFHDELLGYGHIVGGMEKDVAGKGIVFIEGAYGEGKTTILKRLLRRFGGKKRIAYFSCNRIDHNLDVKKLLNEKYGRVGRWLDIMPKNMIILLDEVQALSREDGEELLKFMRRGNIRSIVFVSQQYDTNKFPPEINKLVKRYRLGSISGDDAVHVVRSRVGKLPLLSDKIIRLIFKISDCNVRSLLKNCETVAKRSIALGMSQVDEALVYEVLTQGVPFKEKKKPEGDIEDVSIEDAAEEMPSEGLVKKPAVPKDDIPDLGEESLEQLYY